MRSVLLPLVFAVALLPPPGAAGCVPTTSAPEADVATPWGPRFYVDNDPCASIHPEEPPVVGIDHWIPSVDGTVQASCVLSLWTYEESNGIDGLQRGDEVVDDTCGGEIDPDTLTPY